MSQILSFNAISQIITSCVWSISVVFYTAAALREIVSISIPVIVTHPVFKRYVSWHRHVNDSPVTRVREFCIYTITTYAYTQCTSRRKHAINETPRKLAYIRLMVANLTRKPIVWMHLRNTFTIRRFKDFQTAVRTAINLSIARITRFLWDPLMACHSYMIHAAISYLSCWNDCCETSDHRKIFCPWIEETF